MAEIKINCPREGIAQSPMVGYADIRNCDISSIPGIVRLNNILALKSTTVVDAQVKWFVRDPVTSAKMYAIDSNGVVYQSTNSGVAWAELSDRGGQGQGMAIWRNYLFVAGDTAVDVYGPLDNSPQWTTGWTGLALTSDVLWHPMFVSKNDNKLYIGGGNIVSSVDQATGTFAPGTPSTYTATANALDLPSAYRIKCLEELGNDLRMGTWQGTNVYDVREAVMFSWDRSAVSFGQPVIIPEYGIHAMKNVGNSLIVLAGTTGRIYRSDGVNATMIGKLPIDLSGGKFIEFYPGALTYYKDKIFFGIGHTALAVDGSTAVTIGGMGVYSLQTTSSGNILNLEHLSSALTDGSAAAVKYSALLPISDETLLVGWRSNATYGIDLTTASSFAYGTDYSGYFESPLYTTGSLLRQVTPTEIEFNLARPLRTGEAIRLAYRTDLTADFASNIIGTYTYATEGGVVSVNDVYDFPPCEQIQFRISFKGTATTTPEMRGVTLRW